SVGDLGERVGLVSGFNTLGGIVGSLLAGFVLLPLLHTHRALIATVVLTLSIVGLLIAVVPRARVFQLAAGALTVAVLVLAITKRPLDMLKLATATNVYFEYEAKGDKIIFAHEDTNGGLTLVTDVHGVKTLTTNGKFQGNDAGEMNAQRRFTHYPMLFVPQK